MNTKKIILSLMMLCSMTVAWAQPTPGGGYTANSYSALKACVQNAINNGIPTAKITLTADIYLKDEGELCNTFKGTLDGNGHTIYAGDENTHQSGSHAHGKYLFTYSEGATFKNLTFKDFRADTDEHDNWSVLTSQATNCVFQNITMDNVSVFSNMHKAGTIAGSVTDCTLEDILVMNSDISVDDYTVGGVVGDAVNSTFTRCVVDDNTYVYSDGDGTYGYAGGIVGKCYGCSFTDCVNSAFVGGDDKYIGGIVGYCQGRSTTDYSSFTRCLNTGMVISLAKGNVYDVFFPRYKLMQMGYTIKYYHDKRYVVRTLSADDIEKTTSKSCMGGIIGYAEYVDMSYCTNFGSIYGYAYGHPFRGGLIGQVAGFSEIDNCLSQFDGGDAEYMRGFVGGYTSNVQLTNSLSATTYDMYRKEADFAYISEDSKNNYTLKEGVSSDYQTYNSPEELRLGIVCQRLANQKSLWTQNLGVDEIPLPIGGKGVYYVPNSTSAYGVICLPFPLYSNENISYYRFSGWQDEYNDGIVRLKFRSSDYIPAGEPVLYQLTNHDEIIYSRGIETQIPGEIYGGAWWLNGSFSMKTFEGDKAKRVYYFTDDGGFHHSENAVVAPFSAYFDGPTPDAFKAPDGTMYPITIVIDDDEEVMALNEKPERNYGDVIEVATLDEFKAALDSRLSDDGRTSNANIKLTADLYLSDLPAVEFVNTFRGKLDGNGHTIWGARPEVTHDSNGRYTRKYLFVYSNNASFENLTFKNIRVETFEHSNWAVITSQASGTKFKNITMDNVSVYAKGENAGSIVGYATNCDFDSITVRHSDITATGDNAGGIVGKSDYSQIHNCYVDNESSVYTDGRRAGGIAGAFLGHDWSSSWFTFSLTDCYNNAIVGADDAEFGGIIGWGQNVNIDRCVNAGVIIGADDDDFHVISEKYRRGEYKKTTFTWGDREYIVQELDDDAISDVNGATKGGGIVGKCENVDVNTVKFAQRQILSSANLSPFYVKIGGGGIAGSINCYTVEYCTNYGYDPNWAFGTFDRGGIIGYGDGTSPNRVVTFVEAINCVNADPFGVQDSWKLKKMIGEAKTNAVVIHNLSLQGSDLCSHWIGSSFVKTIGNNYFFDEYDDDPYALVTNDMLASGVVGYWLNARQNKSPWKQNLGLNGDAIPGLYPSHEVATFEYVTSSRVISTAEELREYARLVNSGKNYLPACLANDIDLAGENWTPIGTREHHFIGLFDGRGHTVKNMRVDSGDIAGGLFGMVDIRAEIRNVIVGEGSEVVNNGGIGAAGVVGAFWTEWKRESHNLQEYGLTIKNCGSYANVKVNKHGGGILGRVQGAMDEEHVKVNVDNCFNMGTITADDGDSGLLCGYMKKQGVVRNSWSAGQLRIGAGHSTWPYSIINPKSEGEYLVGYDDRLDIQDCHIVNPAANIDRYNEHPLQSGVSALSLTDGEIGNGKLVSMLRGNWQQNLGTNDCPVPGDKGVHHTRNVSDSSNGYGTICLPYAMKSNDKVAYYQFAESSNENGEIELNFTYTDIVAAGEPALFFSRNTGESVLFPKNGNTWADAPLTPSTSLNEDWYLVGTYDQQVFDQNTDPSSANIYYVSAGAIKNGKKATIAPYRAYFYGPNINTLIGNNQAQARVRIVLNEENGESTSVSLVYDGENGTLRNATSSKTYSLMGTEVGEGYRGIVIRNGKKVLIK